MLGCIENSWSSSHHLSLFTKSWLFGSLMNVWISNIVLTLWLVTIWLPLILWELWELFSFQLHGTSFLELLNLTLGMYSLEFIQRPEANPVHISETLSMYISLFIIFFQHNNCLSLPKLDSLSPKFSETTLLKFPLPSSWSDM